MWQGVRDCATGTVRDCGARAYLAAGGDARGRGARGATRPTFDQGDADHFAAAASPMLRGLPAGQRGYRCLCILLPAAGCPVTMAHVARYPAVLQLQRRQQVGHQVTSRV